MKIQHKLPFIIGVAGHRKINIETDELALKREIKHAFEFWLSKLDKSTPIWFYTGMAEGSDLIVLQVIEELKVDKDLHQLIKIKPCLAMPSQYLEQDFDIDDKKYITKGLAYFLNKTQQYVDETLIIKHGLSEQEYLYAISDNKYGVWRNQLYLNQGAFLAKYCNVLLTLWDGNDSKGVGGTADVVRLKTGMPFDGIQSLPSYLKPFDDFDGGATGVIHHIPVNIEHNLLAENNLCCALAAVNDENLFDGQFLYNGRKMNDGLESVNQTFDKEMLLLIEQVNTFNLNIESDNTYRQQSKKPEQGTLFEQADDVAVHFQKKHKSNLYTFLGLAFLVFFNYEAFSLFIGSQLESVFNTLVLLSLLSIVFLRFRANRLGYKNKYQLARSIAETLRIRAHLNQLGCPPSDNCLLNRQERIRLPVLIQAIHYSEVNEWWTKNRPSSLSGNWLQEQVDFLESRLINSSPQGMKLFSTKRPKHAFLTLGKLPSLFITLAAIIGFAYWGISHFDLGIELNILVTTKNMLLVGLQGMLMLSASVALLLEYNNYEQLFLGYENLLKLFKRAAIIVDNNDSNDAVKHRVYMQLAEEALKEHTDWYFNEAKVDIKLSVKN